MFSKHPHTEIIQRSPLFIGCRFLNTPNSALKLYKELPCSQAAAAIAFGVCSRKRKKEKAPDDQYAIEEEPTIIGR